MIIERKRLLKRFLPDKIIVNIFNNLKMFLLVI